MRTLTLRLAALLLVTGLAGCSHRAASPTEALDSAAAAAKAGRTEARTLALAGFHAWLIQGDVATAQSRFDAAIEQSPAEPYALEGQHLLARRAASPRRALEAALALAARAPQHPLSVSAARFALDMVGTSSETDELILRGAQAALEAGATGEAASLLRNAQVAIHGFRGESEPQAAALKALGALDTATLLGPFSPWHVLAFDEPTPPEKDGALGGSLQGPYGPLTLRTLRAPDGRLDIAGESRAGDVYLMAADVDVPESGAWVVRTVSPASHKVLLDGTPVLERRDFTRPSSTVAAHAVRLEAGRHRLLVKVLKGSYTGAVALWLTRADGRPAAVRYTPATGPAPSGWGKALPEAEAPFLYPTARDLAAALEGEVGTLLADFLAVRDGMMRDADGAYSLMTRLEASSQSPAVLSLRAELSLQQRGIPFKVARGRATRDLEAALTKDGENVAALLQRAALALEDEQPATAQQALKSARAAAKVPSYPLWVLEARVAQALGLVGQQEESLMAALKDAPGLCEALELGYGLARQRDAVARADELVAAQESCPSGLALAAEHARMRGDMERTAGLYQELLARDPGRVTYAASLSRAYVSLRRLDEATAVLRSLRTLWPRNEQVVEELADVRERAGEPAEALALREEALRLDGGDLALRRAVERAKTGQEPLQAYALDGRKALAEYEASRGPEETAAAYVLDAAAAQVFADGSLVNRIHTIQKAVEQGGVQEIAEVNLPSGAQVLALRTLKADGTVLEPENIAGKDSVSLPGVQVGDAVEVEYLLAERARGPGMPGFTASEFYFRLANMSNDRSTYTVVAPKGTGMKVDAHGLKAPAPEVKGEWEVFQHEERRVPPLIPEPESPPSGHEYLPFVVVGAGQTGNEGLVTQYADNALERVAVTSEVESFAREAVGGKKGLEAVKALHAEVMKRIRGRDAVLAWSAASTLAQDRGSRLMLLKAGLEAVGIPARLVAVRTFSADPAPYLFPEDSLLTYLALRVEVPEVGPVWLDTAVRNGPFGELPESALGELEAYALPEPGRPLERLKTPPRKEEMDRLVKLELELGADGQLTGKGEDVYLGFPGAQYAEAFDAVSGERRKQAVEGAVGRYFAGAELTALELEHEEVPGAPLKMRYAFRVPRFGRAEGKRLTLDSVTMPSFLGRRYVQVSTRTTPLFIGDTEVTRTQVKLTLPEGWRLTDPQARLEVSSAFGKLVRTEKQEGRVLTLEETLSVERGRVPPQQYEDFAHFAGEVDLLQTRDLIIERP